MSTSESFTCRAGQGVSVDLFDGDDAGIVPVQLAKGILEGPGEYLLIRDMEDILVYLLGAFAVQGSQDVIGPICVGGHKAVISQLVVNILLVGLYPAVLVPHQSIGHRVLVYPPVGGYATLVAGAAHQGDVPLAQGGINSGEHTGVVAGTKSIHTVSRLEPPSACISCSRRCMYLIGMVDACSNTLATAVTPSKKA